MLTLFDAWSWNFWNFSLFFVVYCKRQEELGSVFCVSRKPQLDHAAQELPIIAKTACSCELSRSTQQISCLQVQREFSSLSLTSSQSSQTLLGFHENTLLGSSSSKYFPQHLYSFFTWLLIPRTLWGLTWSTKLAHLHSTWPVLA